MTKIYTTPFATSGDRAAVPDAVQSDGSLSITQGWSPDYELEIGADPNAKPVDRSQHNQLWYDMTSSFGYVQKHGFAEWSSAWVGGYPIFAWVRHLDKVWMSLITSNTDEPSAGVPTKWADMTSVLRQASETVSGVSAFATNAESVAGTINDKSVHPAGLAAAINAARPRNLGRWSSASASTISAQGTWINIASINVNVRAGYPVIFASKMIFMSPNLAQGDNYYAIRLVAGSTVLDVTSHNVVGSKEYSQDLVLGARANLPAGVNAIRVQFYKSFAASVVMNANNHNGTNTVGATSWLEVGEGAA